MGVGGGWASAEGGISVWSLNIRGTVRVQAWGT